MDTGRGRRRGCTDARMLRIDRGRDSRGVVVADVPGWGQGLSVVGLRRIRATREHLAEHVLKRRHLLFVELVVRCCKPPHAYSEHMGDASLEFCCFQNNPFSINKGMCPIF